MTMENWLYGFGGNINNYSQREILFYMLFFSVLIYFSGKNMEKDVVRGRYFKLIRYKSYSHWWKLLCLRTFAKSIILVMFAVILFFLCSNSRIYLFDFLYAVSLWMFGLTTVNMFQLLLINSNCGVKISFMVIMVIEVLSLYGTVFGKRVAPFLPGSFLMFRRSSFIMEGGFSWMWVIVIQVLINVCIFIFGYRIHRRH